MLSVLDRSRVRAAYAWEVIRSAGNKAESMLDLRRGFMSGQEYRKCERYAVVL